MVRQRVCCSFFLAASFLIAQAQSFSGTVVGVTDGDTIKVLKAENQRYREIKVRFHGVDAPESKQAFGTKAKQFVSNLVFRKQVRVEQVVIDRYGRLVGRVYYTSTDGKERLLNLDCVKAGMAWWYDHYAPNDVSLRDAQEAARRVRIGLWSDPSPVAPWDYRRSQR